MAKTKMVRIGEEEHELLKKLAISEGTTLGEWVERVIRRYHLLDRYGVGGSYSVENDAENQSEE